MYSLSLQTMFRNQFTTNCPVRIRTPHYDPVSCCISRICACKSESGWGGNNNCAFPQASVCKLFSHAACFKNVDIQLNEKCQNNMTFNVNFYIIVERKVREPVTEKYGKSYSSSYVLSPCSSCTMALAKSFPKTTINNYAGCLW